MRSLLLSALLLTLLAGCDTTPTASTTTPATEIKPEAPAPYLEDLGVQDTRWGSLRVLYGMRPSKSTKPTYPRSLRKQDITGAVVLDVLVDEAGKPAEIVLNKSSGYTEFDDNAIKCVKQWTYPAWQENGHPSKVVSRQNIDFMIFIN